MLIGRHFEPRMPKAADVYSERVLLRVERGKGGHYRNAMLSEDLLAPCVSVGRLEASKA